MRYLATTLTLFLTLSPPAAMADMIPNALVGAGASKCAQYNALRNGPDRRDVEVAYFTWAQGYLSRMNAYETQLANMQPVNLKPAGFGVEAQISWLNSYCSYSPSTWYGDAVFQLYKEIRSRNPIS